MKLFTFIMSFFLLYLSCLPCNDSKDCNTKATIEFSDNGDHNQHNHDAENCAPFCTCSCCSVSVYFSSFPKPQDAEFVMQPEKYPLYSPSFKNIVSSCIWQPPRLS